MEHSKKTEMRHYDSDYMEHPENLPTAYIAGALNDMANPYLKNVHRMLIWAEKIRKLGYAVFIPGIDLLLAITIGTLSYNQVFNNSQPFLARSDIVFVVPGYEKSKGTARELNLAQKCGIPIFVGEEGYENLKKIKKSED